MHVGGLLRFRLFWEIYMITIEKEFEFQETYPLSRLGKREELLFFDIETTGFSGVNNMAYLIG